MTGEFAFTLKLLEDGEEITNIPWPVYNVVDSMVREYRQWPGVGGKWVRRDEKWNEHGHQEGLPVGGTPIVSKWPGLSQTIQSDSEISVFFRNNQAYFVFWKPSVGGKGAWSYTVVQKREEWGKRSKFDVHRLYDLVGPLVKDIEQDGTAISAMVEAGGQGDVLFVLRNTSDGVVGYTCSPSSKKGIGIHPWKLEGKDLEAKNVKNGEKVTCPSAITTAFRGADKRVHIWDANVDYVCEEAVKPIEGGGKRTQRVLVVARKEARPRPQHKNI